LPSCKQNIGHRRTFVFDANCTIELRKLGTRQHDHTGTRIAPVGP
jgi:hypothetical protein